MSHARDDDSCLGQEGCLICFRNIQFPPLIYELFRSLLIPDRPGDRLTAFAVSNLLRPLLENYETDFDARAMEILETMM